jgi:hypothetical protein
VYPIPAKKTVSKIIHIICSAAEKIPERWERTINERKVKIMNKPKIVRLTFALASLFAVTLASGQSMQSAVDAPQARRS